MVTEEGDRLPHLTPQALRNLHHLEQLRVSNIEGGGGGGMGRERERDVTTLWIFVFSDLSLELDKLWRSMYKLRKPRVLLFITQELEEKVGSK